MGFVVTCLNLTNKLTNVVKEFSLYKWGYKVLSKNFY